MWGLESNLQFQCQVWNMRESWNPWTICLLQNMLWHWTYIRGDSPSLSFSNLDGTMGYELHNKNVGDVTLSSCPPAMVWINPRDRHVFPAPKSPSNNNTSPRFVAICDRSAPRSCMSSGVSMQSTSWLLRLYSCWNPPLLLLYAITDDPAGFVMSSRILFLLLFIRKQLVSVLDGKAVEKRWRIILTIRKTEVLRVARHISRDKVWTSRRSLD